MRTLLTGIGRLWSAGQVLEGAAVLVDGSRVAWVGPDSAAPRDADIVEDCGGALLTPGLVDAHTHPIYAGNRFAEIAVRSAGASYADVAAAGGGIASTVRATRAAATEDLRAGARERLHSWLTSGTTTVEAKTGYLLTRDGELGAVALLRSLATEPDMPRLSVTFLAAHAVPPDWPGTRRGYAEAVASWCPAAARAGADNVDVFCDEGYFTVEESQTVLRAGAAAGLTPRVHADELARTGGARLAARLRCASADHLLTVTAEDAAALAAADVVAVLCPATALHLGVSPPVGLLRAAGVTLALGSDHNPGQCGITSMPLVVALAVAALGLSVEEALWAATLGGARSLRLADRGRVSPGMLADLVLWDTAHEGAFAWAFGLRPRRVWCGGQPLGPTP